MAEGDQRGEHQDQLIARLSLFPWIAFRAQFLPDEQERSRAEQRNRKPACQEHKLRDRHHLSIISLRDNLIAQPQW
jgi:hypothetical protein